MSVKTVGFRGNLGSAQTDDGFSPGVWSDCPMQGIIEGTIPGIFREWNFDAMPKTPATTEGNFGDWSQFSSTGGTVDPAASGHGYALGSDGDDEGASIRTRANSFKIIRTGYKLWYEAQIRTSTITDTKHGILFGLCDNTAFTATMPITAAGAIGDLNMVGFRRDEADGDYLDTVYKADGVTAVTVQADAQVLVADTDVKVGFVFEPAEDPFLHDPSLSGTRKYNLFFYGNGIRLATQKQIPSAAGTDFPNDVFMGPFFAVLNATASTPGTTAIRRLRVCQSFSPSLM